MDAPRHDAPKVEIDLGGTKHTVVFDFDRLVAIEAATGRTAHQTLSEFATYAPDVPKDVKPTPAQMREAAERFSLTTVGRFVAGCLGIPPAEIGRKIPLRALPEVFMSLVPGFVEAIQQLNGAQEPAADPTQAPQASGG